MSIQTLSSVTLATIENYRHAANLAARAYRTGSERLIGAFTDRLERSVDPRAEELAPRLAETMVKVRGRVTEIAFKGIDEAATLTEKAVDFGSDEAVKGVHRIADFAAGVEAPMLANGLQAAARLSLPTAKVALAVSKKVNEGAKTLSSVAKGRKSLTAVAEEAATSVKRTAKRTQRKATTTARETVASVRKAAAKPRQTVARAQRRTKAAVNEAVAAVEKAVKAPRKPRARRADAATA